MVRSSLVWELFWVIFSSHCSRYSYCSKDPPTFSPHPLLPSHSSELFVIVSVIQIPQPLKSLLTAQIKWLPVTHYQKVTARQETGRCSACTAWISAYKENSWTWCIRYGTAILVHRLTGVSGRIWCFRMTGKETELSAAWIPATAIMYCSFQYNIILKMLLQPTHAGAAQPHKELYLLVVSQVPTQSPPPPPPSPSTGIAVCSSF